MYRAIRIAVLLLCTLFLTGVRADNKRPNIVIFLADDLGYADVGAQGILKDVRTPNIDAIAKAGTRFTNGYVSCPVCSPTRAGLMTGRYQTRFGHEVNCGPDPAPNFGLPVDQVTIAQALKDAGYTTGAFGKWHLGFNANQHPLKRGFDEFYGFLGGAHSYLQAVVGDPYRGAIMRGTEPVKSITYTTDDFAREATDFVEHHANDEKPFFIYLPFNAVHGPPQATAKYLERFKDVKEKKRHVLLAKLSALDDGVGQVMNKLREHKIEDNTLIFFLSDNGGPTGGNGSRNDPFRGVKGQVFEGGVREPFMVQWNGHIPAGKVDDRKVISLDIFPTALAAAGAATPSNVQFDGVNLLPYLTGEKKEDPHDSLYWRFGPKWAVRDGNMKLLHEPAEGTLMFDLAKDPSEKHDLSKERPDEFKQLKAKYDAWNAKNIPQLWHDSREGKKGGKGQEDAD
jgi:arylsulfatase A-like enzyme